MACIKVCRETFPYGGFMTHTVSSPAAMQFASTRLTELIQVLETRKEFGHITEHLHSAHTYLLGSMPREYEASLEDARKAAAGVDDADLRHSLDNAIAMLREETHRSDAHAEDLHQTAEKPHGRVPTEARSRLWDFFSTADVSFGVFYPKNHAVATFPTFEMASAAVVALRAAGFTEREAIAARSEEMLVFLAELKKHLGLWGRMMGEISRFFGTEEIFVKQDVREAVHGAGFVAVFCPTEAEAGRVNKLLEPYGPVAIRHYWTGGIENVL
jgi:hypothetical protein